MAKRTVVELLDDLDGTEADESVSFALDGVSYEIDLTTKNAKKLRSDFAKWVESARKVSGAATRRSHARPANKAAELAAIRAWARENGYQVSNRGRIAAPVREAYAAAH